MTPVDELLCGRYRIDRRIGQGGMADVFRAVDTDDGRAVAVKLVRSADPELARRFAQEAKALARLVHPGMVRLLDAGVHDEQAFLVMELVEGPTLAARLRRGPLSPRRTAMLGGTLAGALAYVHAQGIVHRDVKPANVLLGPGSRVRLADFGIARLAGTSSLTATGTTLGTAGYMAPEQLEHHDVGPAADVWSLGMILLECLTGRRVYQGSPTEVVARRLAGPVPVPDDLPAPWRMLLEGMLAHDPRSRLSAEHVGTLLGAAPFGEPWDPAAPSAWPTAVLEAVTGGEQGDLRPAGDPAPTQAAPAPTQAAPAPTQAAPAPTQAAPGPPPSTTTAPRWWRRHPARRRVAPPAPEAGGGPCGPWPWWSSWQRRRGWPTGRWPEGAARPPAGPTTPPPRPRPGRPRPPRRPPPPHHRPPCPPPARLPPRSVRDAEAAVSAGTLTSQASKTLLDELNQTVSAASDGSSGQASAGIAAMDGSVADDVRSGAVTAAEASTLVADVARLAGALGVSTSTATTSPPSTGDTGTGNTGTGTTGSGTGNTGSGNTGSGNTGTGGHGGR